MKMNTHILFMTCDLVLQPNPKGKTLESIHVLDCKDKKQRDNLFVNKIIKLLA